MSTRRRPAAAPPLRPAATRPRTGHAEPAARASNVRRLKRIEGQVRGLQRMVEDDRYCPDIIEQVAAVQEALRGVARQLLRHHLSHCAADAIRQGPEHANRTYDELLELVYRHLR
jgi:CsoR family transcriptional regulator, copper-sensing transcriptional repressor